MINKIKIPTKIFFLTSITIVVMGVYNNDKLSISNINPYETISGSYVLSILVLIVFLLAFFYFFVRILKFLIQDFFKINTKFNRATEKDIFLMEYSDDAFFVIAADNSIKDVNNNACELLGYSKKQLIKMNMLNLYSSDRLERISEDWNLLKKNKILFHEGVLDAIDGTKVEVEIRKKIFIDGTGYFALVRDITNRKRIEAELIECKTQLELFIKHSPTSIAMFDNEMRYIATSCRWLKDYNLVGQHLLGKTHYEIFPEIPQHWIEIHQRCLNGAIEKNEEDFFTRVDGSMDWLRWEIHPWHKASGKIGGIIMFTEVITERILAKQVITSSEETKRHIMNSALDGIVGMHHMGFITIWTPQSEKIFGWSEDEVIGKRMSDIIIPHKYRENHERGLRHYNQTGKGPMLSKIMEISALHKNGKEFPIELSIVTVEQDKNKFFCAFIRDITKRKKTEEALIRYNENLEKTNNELDLFVYSISHDLRAPLKSMLGLINITKDSIEPNDDVLYERFEMLNSSVVKLDNFIEGILDYSRNSRMELTNDEINFEAIIKEIMNSYQFDVQEIDFTLKVVANDKEKFVTDKRRLIVVLSNLISNAIKYRDFLKKKSFLKIRVISSKEHAVVIVEDNGIGIDDKEKEKIFEMFYRATNVSTGSGLGLYIVKETLTKLGGNIQIESKVNVGTKFIIKIVNENNSLN